MSCCCNTYGCKCEKWCPHCSDENCEKIEMCLCCIVNRLKREQNEYNRRLNATINNLVNNVYNKVVNKVIGDVEQNAKISVGISDTGEYKCLIQGETEVPDSAMYDPKLSNCNGFEIDYGDEETYLIRISGINKNEGNENDKLSAPYRYINMTTHKSSWGENN